MDDETPKPVTITCPHCGLIRQVPRDKVPSRPVRATCPRCRNAFAFDPAAPCAPPETETGPTAPLPQQSPLEAEWPAPPPPSSPPPPRPPRPPRREPVSTAAGLGLSGISDLLTAAWTIFQARFGVLFSIYLLSILLLAAPPLLGAGLGMLLVMVLPFGQGGVMALFTISGGIAGILGGSWGFGALLYAALDDSLDIRGSFARGREKILPLLWASLLTGFVVTGGYLLLFIPGLIFSVWFLMAPFVLLDDNTRGMSALLKSRALVQGRWFDMFLRLVVMWACSALVSAIPMVGPLVLLVAAPYLVLYQALIFKDFKRVAEPVSYGCSFSDKVRWPAVAAIAYIAMLAALVTIFGMALLKQLEPFVGKGGFKITESGKGYQTPSGEEGGWRVIPIPGQGGQQPTTPAPSDSAGASVPAASPLQGHSQQDKAPENIHVFIYAVNCPGRILANGVELKQIEDKPDMQYNYNMSGDKLRYGQNTITVEYSPLAITDNMLKPRIHLKISQSGAGQRQVLGDWDLSETSAGQKTLDLEVPKPATQP